MPYIAEELLQARRERRIKHALLVIVTKVHMVVKLYVRINKHMG